MRGERENAHKVSGWRCERVECGRESADRVSGWRCEEEWRGEGAW